MDVKAKCEEKQNEGSGEGMGENWSNLLSVSKERILDV